MKIIKAIISFILISAILLFSLCSHAKEMNKQEIDKTKTINGIWSFTDDLGRSPDKNQKFEKQTKYVGIFYHLLSEAQGKPNNTSEIFEKNEDALSNKELWSKRQAGYYWGEPVFGYYDMRYDKYVIRKHAQLLNDAGVDTIIIDYTNAFVNGQASSLTDHYKGILNNLCDTFNEIRKEGGETPKITFLLTWSDIGAEKAFNQLYKDFYSKAEYEELWFNWNQKILIIGSGSMVEDDFHKKFEFRLAWPFYAKPDAPNYWPWLSVYPQEPGYTDTNDCEVVAVSVAQNWREGISLKEFCFFSDRDENGNFIAQGRSFTNGNKKLLKNPVSNEYKSNEGANFNQQWERALELNPDFIFITGWNELCVARFVDETYPVIGKFCDQFTTEFSRDIEPTLQGNLKDSFYCQMVINIRKYKSNNIANQNNKNITYEPDLMKNDDLSKTYRTVSINENFNDWDDVVLTYKDDINDTAKRDYKGYGSYHYTNLTGRNDIISTKVAYDNDNIYFYAETKNNITHYSDPDWMNLFIGITNPDGSLKKDLPNWEGYQYVLNRENVGDGVTRLERCKGGWNWEVANDYIPYCVKDNKIEIAIPRRLLNIDDGRNISIIFKWTDNIASEGDVMKFYTDGDTAPNARFYYVFNNIKNHSFHKTKTLTVLITVLSAILILPIILIYINKKRRGKKL